MKRSAILSLILILLPLWLKAGTIRQQIENLKEQYGVRFVYDSSIKLDRPYTGGPCSGLSLQACLDELLKGSGLKWERKGDFIMIMPLRKYTLSGYIYQDDGETAINATVFDLTSKSGTLTNEHGYFSLTLTEGEHDVKFSTFGSGEQVEKIDLRSNLTHNVKLKIDNELDEVVVIADLNSPLNTTHTGKISLTAKNLHKEYALLSSPDVVKILQNLSGVAAGTELISGLYVHGGGNDENLFLLDGTPLYQVNHLGGLFSAFNTDVIKNIDFYKSGFPARYGGRLSSVIDVRTKDGNMKEFHGSFTVGLIDGRVQFEGPIQKDRTSFNIAMRRTWLDMITIPLQALHNRGRKDKSYFRYGFHDFNAKVTHIFSERSRADISLYSGNDVLRLDDRSKSASENSINRERTDLNLQWGNLTAALNWKYQFSPKLYSVFTGIYTHNRSRQKYLSDETTYEGEVLEGISHTDNRSVATINDGGCQMELDYRPNQSNHIRFGSSFLMHFFRPQNHSSNSYSGDGSGIDTLRRNASFFTRGHELALYAEDDIALGERTNVNIGAHYTLFHITGKTYHSLEPRISLSHRLTDRLTVKTSYTEMNQFMHQLSNSYLNLPVDYWVPSTRTIKPMRSRQLAAGIYWMLPGRIKLNMEGFYKTMENLMEYDEVNTLTPPFDSWESHVKSGRGKAYGLEWEGSYGNEMLSASASYTLAWNRRNFPDFHKGWYPDKFDNRHKINLNVQYCPKDGIELYASWCYHSGNRMTVPQQIVQAPDIPGIGGGGQAIPIYEAPNNMALPDYHRLDLGASFRKKTKRGGERIWNISIYNAYSRLNPFFASVKQRPDGSFYGESSAAIPIIPSFSYTLKF